MRAINFLFIITILNYFNEKNDPFLKDGDHTDFHGLMYQGPYDWNNSIYGNPDANTDGNLLGDGLKNENNYVLLNAGANSNDAKDALEALEELVDYLPTAVTNKLNLAKMDISVYYIIKITPILVCL